MRTLTLPPLTEADNSPMKWLSVKFDSGLVSIEITDEGGGAFAVIETSEPWRIEADELAALAKWVSDIASAIDIHNQTWPHEALGWMPHCPQCSTNGFVVLMTRHGYHLDGSPVYQCARCKRLFTKFLSDTPWVEVPADEVLRFSVQK